MNVWCLHGNLQLPAVWDRFRHAWHITTADKQIPVSLQCPSLWDAPASRFDEWAKDFCQKVATLNAGPNWLIGYSLGGRLALHAVLEQPDLWKGAVVIGAHPGYDSEEERSKQIARDELWAARFADETNAWKTLLQTWDALPIFDGRPNPTERPELAFSRTGLAACFRHFSKGRQSFLTPLLAKLSAPPIYFFSGIHDVKYTTLGQQLASDCEVVQHKIIPDAGHRVPWENTSAFIREIQVFLDATT